MVDKVKPGLNIKNFVFDLILDIQKDIVELLVSAKSNDVYLGIFQAVLWLLSNTRTQLQKAMFNPSKNVDSIEGAINRIEDFFVPSKRTK